jgi:hypothetical protein
MLYFQKILFGWLPPLQSQFPPLSLYKWLAGVRSPANKAGRTLGDLLAVCSAWHSEASR